MTGLTIQFRRLAVVVALVSFVPPTASAQGVGGGNIAGVVRDASGAVMPGVTVEAASPALIERVRSVITDGNGRYQIVDLRPGTYAVTFTLSGFRTVRREGIELTTGFIATVNANLDVGSLEETITVTGEAPLVDVQGTIQQQVLSGEVVRDLPLAKNSGAVSAIVAAAMRAPGNADVGGTQSEVRASFSVHGARASDMLNLRDGMINSTFVSSLGNNPTSSINSISMQETAIGLSGGLSAESSTGGSQVNVIPREGGNRTNASFSADFTHRNLQSDNLDAELEARGATRGGDVKRLYDVAGGVGGPLMQDRLWYFASSRYWIGETYVPGNFYNKLQGVSVNGLPPVFYEPDLSRPAFSGGLVATEASVRLTWQAGPRHKLTYTPAVERNCNCLFSVTGAAPEASTDSYYWPYSRHQVSWQSPVSNRLLLQAGFAYLGAYRFPRATGAQPDDIVVVDRTRNYRYGNDGTSLSFLGRQDFGNYNVNGSVSYVTGSHAFKIGGLLLKAGLDYEKSIPNLPDDIASSAPAAAVFYTFAGSAPGVARPELVTLFATPYGYPVRMRQTGLYAQDQWTINRLTLNLGLRYEGLNAHAPAHSLPAGKWVGAREFPEAKNIPDWHDVSPRLGAAYDLFGNGRTAVKFSLGRFLSWESMDGVPGANNPATLMVTSATRTWNDVNGDYVPQESELGPLSNANFGKLVPGTEWDRGVLEGWHVRPFSWQGSVTVQHQLLQRVALNVGYFRTWYGNFRTTDNRAVGANDFDQFCVTVPGSANIPTAGQQVCGLYDVKPQFFGASNNFVTRADNYGGQTEVYSGVDVTLNARLTGGGMVIGGVSVGRTVTDSCDLRAALPETAQSNPYCRVEPAWGSATGFKVSVVTPLPWDLQASANFQNIPGVSTSAVYSVGAAEVLPSLGRPLASGPRGRTNVTVLEPDTLFREGRINQLNFAVARVFQVGGTRVQPRVELHNALNANPIVQLNNQVGPAFDQVRGILGPRILKFAFRFDF